MNKKMLLAIPLCLLLALPSVADYLCIAENEAGFNPTSTTQWHSTTYKANETIILKHTKGGSYSLYTHGTTPHFIGKVCSVNSNQIVCETYRYVHFKLNTVNNRFIALTEGNYIFPFVYDPDKEYHKGLKDYLGDSAQIIGGVCSKL